MILQLGLNPKIPDQRKELDCSEFMFKNKPGHIAINKCKQEPDANYSFVPFMKINISRNALIEFVQTLP